MDSFEIGEFFKVYTENKRENESKGIIKCRECNELLEISSEKKLSV